MEWISIRRTSKMVDEYLNDTKGSKRMSLFWVG